jgi:hypothetical protein
VRNGRSVPSWTWGGEPLPFVASDPYWKREFRDGLLSYRGLYERSLRRFVSEVDAATIPVEAAQARIVLVAGGDDVLWPSELFARSIARGSRKIGLSDPASRSGSPGFAAWRDQPRAQPGMRMAAVTPPTWRSGARRGMRSRH